MVNIKLKIIRLINKFIWADLNEKLKSERWVKSNACYDYINYERL